jgi:hypothetical protein
LIPAADLERFRALANNTVRHPTWSLMAQMQDAIRTLLVERDQHAGLKLNVEELRAELVRMSTLDGVAEVLQHALELGYLGEGSTQNWAKRALARAYAAGALRPPPPATRAGGEGGAGAGET